MANSETAAATPLGAGAKSMRSLSSLETGSYWRFFGELALLYIYSSEWDGFWGSKFTIRMLGRPFFYHYSLNMSLIGLTQICGDNSDWSVTIAQIWGKALIGLSQMSKYGEQNIRLIRALPQIWAIVTDQSELFPQISVNPVSDIFSALQLWRPI